MNAFPRAARPATQLVGSRICAISPLNSVCSTSCRPQVNTPAFPAPVDSKQPWAIPPCFGPSTRRRVCKTVRCRVSGPIEPDWDLDDTRSSQFGVPEEDDLALDDVSSLSRSLALAPSKSRIFGQNVDFNDDIEDEDEVGEDEDEEHLEPPVAEDFVLPAALTPRNEEERQYLLRQVIQAYRHALKCSTRRRSGASGQRARRTNVLSFFWRGAKPHVSTLRWF